MQNEFIFHSPFKKGDYRATIAGRIENGTLHIGAALCSPEDNFCKKSGRDKAMGRTYANSSKHLRLKGFATKNRKEIVEKIKEVSMFVILRQTTDLISISEL